MKIEQGTPCLVTGASSGIGREISLQLGRRGCRVALLARSEGALEELAEEIRNEGGEAIALTADVRSEDAMSAAVAKAVAAFGSLRLVVANAGLGRYAEVKDQPAEHVETTIQTNYVGLTRLARLTLPHLLAATPAHFVGVTSSAALIPHRLASAYCASKAASNAYLAALRLEVVDRQVGVSWICPGLVETPFVQKADLEPEKDLPLLARLLVRTLSAEEVARATVKAVERNKSEVTLPAMMRLFAMSRRLTPRFADWLNRKTG
ncbi:MAG: SDR family NAD(P)-dependent oxidoreductase [Deltaproteobacteria bacterium]|nr:SDR family NAD(P)-dependent oxidoreductase [Deltaproteobacteria bacterium]